MKFKCENCGSSKFDLVNGYRKCKYCDTCYDFDNEIVDSDGFSKSCSSTINILRSSFAKSVNYEKSFRGGVRL